MEPAILTIDVGTGSARAGVVDLSGRIRALHAVPHETRYPHHSWAEQSPDAWWEGTCASISAVLEAIDGEAIALEAVVTCGQTHAPILLDADGRLLNGYASLWNDKRAEPQANALRARADYRELHEITGNPAAPSWPGIKLAWYRENAPELLDAAAVALMPKDFINFRLCGEPAGDKTEAGYSFLYNSRTGAWDDALCGLLHVPRGLLPELLRPDERVGGVTQTAAEETGLPAGLPVVVGAGDYPAAVLGSGVCRVGQASDITGTSALLSMVTAEPLIDPDVMNAAAAGQGWLAFSILDAAGDAVRWGRRELEDEAIDLGALTARAAAVPAGADGLVFLPYLTGERLGQGPRSRAAFFGLTAAHGKAHMHRAITEGVAMGLKHVALPQLSRLGAPQSIVSAGGGAHSDLLLRTKASVFEVPFVPVAQVECGLLGGAALAFSCLGRFADPEEAAERLVSYGDPVEPDPALASRYADLFEVFRESREAVRGLNDAVSRFSAEDRHG